MTKHKRRIVVGIDYSSTSELALQKAVALASKEPGTELHIIHVVQLLPEVDVATIASGLTVPEASLRLTNYLDERKKLWGAPQTEWVPHVRVESAATQIAQLASDLEAELVIVGSHGRRGAERFFLGSVAEKVVRLSACSVLIVRPEDQRESAQPPRIEPPCPRCLEVRRTSDGTDLWCSEHREQLGQRSASS